MSHPIKTKPKSGLTGPVPPLNKQVKMELFGEELYMKTVKKTGNSGRVYLPATWIGRRVKIIRIN